MERTNGMEKGLRMAAMSLFLLAALLSTGCGQNALLNPVSDSAQGGSIVNPAGDNAKPAGDNAKPAGDNAKP